MIGLLCYSPRQVALWWNRKMVSHGVGLGGERGSNFWNSINTVPGKCSKTLSTRVDRPNRKSRRQRAKQLLYIHVVSTTETVSLSNSSLNTAVNMTSYWVDGRRLLRMYLFLLPSKSTWRSETHTNTKSPLTSRKILCFQQSVILKKKLGLVPPLCSDLTSAVQGQQVCDGHFKKRQMILHDRSFLF